MSDDPRAAEQAGYELTICGGSDLSQSDVEKCVAIIRQGDAVDPGSAGEELPRASVVAIARTGGDIVGVGAIKRIRRGYASTIAERSGIEFPSDTPELGYVAVDEKHRGNRLSPRIVAELLKKNAASLFATTDNDWMKNTLEKAGFRRQGREWDGKRGRLSLWLRK